MKKYYLVVESTLFVDPHGSPDDGGIVKKVEYTDLYNNLDPSLTYNEDFEPVDIEDEDYYQGSEDGYNSRYIEYNFKEISKEEFDRAKNIIEEYNKL